MRRTVSREFGIFTCFGFQFMYFMNYVNMRKVREAVSWISSRIIFTDIIEIICGILICWIDW